MERAYKRACEAVDKHEPICDQVAAEFQVNFEDVKNLNWFLLELAERLG